MLWISSGIVVDAKALLLEAFLETLQHYIPNLIRLLPQSHNVVHLNVLASDESKRPYTYRRDNVEMILIESTLTSSPDVKQFHKLETRMLCCECEVRMFIYHSSLAVFACLKNSIRARKRWLRSRLRSRIRLRECHIRRQCSRAWVYE